MKLFQIIGLGALAAGACELAVAAHPPLDRPTPPPCCADGVCYPNPVEWGWYRTQWRRWPTVQLEPTSATTPTPGERFPDVRPFETPPPELEDRRAPPPTKPRADAEGGVETPDESPLGAPSNGGESPTTTPLTPPSSPLTPAPATPTTPPDLTPSPTRMPWDEPEEPTGDWDPPPALPSIATATSQVRFDAPRSPQKSVRPALDRSIRPTATRRQAPNGDPPPMLPTSLASAAY